MISYILAFAMLLSGMCFECTKADSFLEYTFAQGPEAYIASGGAAISDEEICTTEMLGIRSVFNVRQFVNRNLCTRRNVRASLVLLGTDAGLHIYSNFFTSAGIVWCPRLCLQTVILNYIHNKDGKKRI